VCAHASAAQRRIAWLGHGTIAHVRASEDEPLRPPGDSDVEGVNRRYRRLSRLGGGGMAEVFAVLDQQTGRRVALKRPQAPRSAEQKERAHELFTREYHTLAQLAHPRIVEVYDFGIDDIGPYYTMELLDGGDLEELKPCGMAFACAIARDVCSALSFLHSRRIVHRDVSPRNVRCTSDGLAKLIDFGVMARMGPNKLLLGTPVYCAPEVLYMQALDGRTDLYALGATLYYVLTGQHAYPARSFADLPGAWKRELKRPSELAPGISEAMDELVLELLQLPMEQRPRSAGDVMERLSAIEGRTFQEHSLVAQAYLSTPAFVGRELELARVRSKAMRASNARGGAILIRGPSGVGRSHFLDASALAAKLCGLLVIRADAADAARNSFGMLRRFTQQLVQLMPELPARLSPEERALLGQVVPDLTRPSAAAPPAMSALASVHDAARKLILAAAEQQPLLIAVDDVERADEPSLLLLAALARASERARLLIVATLADGATASAVPFELFTRACSAQTLSRFTLSETQALLTSLFGASVQLEQLTQRLHLLSSGSPRDLMRLCQHLVDTGVARYEHGAWLLADVSELQLPGDLSELLASRSRSLSTAARELACALALCSDQSFSFTECLRLSAQSEEAALLQALDALLGADIVRASDGAYMLSDRAWGNVLAGELSPIDRRSLQRRLAAVFEQRPGGEFRRVQHLLAAGDNALALDLLVTHGVVSVRETNRDPDAFFSVVRALPNDWMQTYARAVEVCRELNRPLRDEHALRVRWAGLVAVVGVPGDAQLSVLVEQTRQASPLPEWEGLDPSLPAAERFARAMELALARYEAQPEHTRLMDPAAAIDKLTEAVRFAVGANAVRYDVAAVRALPSLAPFFEVAPHLRVIDQLLQGVHARITGRVDEARELYHSLLERIAQPDRGALSQTSVEYTRLLVLSALSLLEASLGLDTAAAHLPEIERNPLFQVNASLIRMLSCLYRGDLAGADACQRTVDALRLKNALRQSFEYGHLALQLQVYVALEDVSRIKHCLSDVSQITARYPGWRPVQVYGRAELLRLRGDARGAAALLRDALSQVAAGDHQLWPQLAAAEVRALDALGCSAEAAERGGRALALALSKLGPSACLPLWLAVGLARARAGMPDATEPLTAALEHLTTLGASGLWCALVHEAHAIVAIAQLDADGFGAALACFEAERDALPPALLAARAQRLRREAARRGLLAQPQLADATDHGYDDADQLEVRLHACRTRVERGQVALAWLKERSGAECAYLFEVMDREAVWVASTLQAPPDDSLHELARRYLTAELNAQEHTTGSQHAPTGSASITRDDAFRPVLLHHYADGARVITGLVVFAVRAGQVFVYPGDAARRLSRILHEITAVSSSLG